MSWRESKSNIVYAKFKAIGKDKSQFKAEYEYKPANEAVTKETGLHPAG